MSAQDVFKLPLTKRLEQYEVNILEKNLGPSKVFIDGMLASGFRSTNHILTMLVDNGVIPEEHAHQLYSSVFSYRYQRLNGTLFQLSDYALTMFALMDIGAKTPVSHLKAPYEQIYIHFGEGINIGLHDPDRHATSNLQGVYINSFVTDRFPGTSTAREALGISEGSPVRVMEFLFNTEPVGHVLGDITKKFVLFIQDEDEMLGDMLKRFFVYYNNVTTLSGLRINTGERDSYMDENIEMYESIMLVAKTLLYINSSGSVIREDYAKTRLLSKLERAKKKHKGKVEEKLNKAYDKIIVGPATKYTPKTSTMSGDGGDKVAPHWRRGHTAVRRTGKGRTESKVVWIEPVLINAHLIIGDNVPGTKTYNI